MYLLVVLTLQLTILFHVDANGIDVSHHNGKIDWAKVKGAGYSFVFIKSSQGASYVDPMLVSNWNDALKNQFKVGVHHSYLPTVLYKRQLENIVRICSKVAAKPYAIALGVEVSAQGKISKAQYSDDIYSFLQLLRSKFSSHIFIYTSKSFWNDNIDWKRHDFTKYLLWVSHYTNKRQPYMPGNWTKWTMWQYSGIGKVNGIKGNVDLNRLQF